MTPLRSFRLFPSICRQMLWPLPAEGRPCLMLWAPVAPVLLSNTHANANKRPLNGNVNSLRSTGLASTQGDLFLIGALAARGFEEQPAHWRRRRKGRRSTRSKGRRRRRSRRRKGRRRRRRRTVTFIWSDVLRARGGWQLDRSEIMDTPVKQNKTKTKGLIEPGPRDRGASC